MLHISRFRTHKLRTRLARPRRICAALAGIVLIGLPSAPASADVSFPAIRLVREALSLVQQEHPELLAPPVKRQPLAPGIVDILNPVIPKDGVVVPDQAGRVLTFSAPNNFDMAGGQRLPDGMIVFHASQTGYVVPYPP
ncbi:MAG: hypothetical protein ACKOXM_08000, partial [Agromyces sp.]